MYVTKLRFFGEKAVHCCGALLKKHVFCHISQTVIDIIKMLTDSSGDTNTQIFGFLENSLFWNLIHIYYIVPRTERESNIFRLLDTDNHTIIPFKTHVRILISSADVLHAPYVTL